MFASFLSADRAAGQWVASILAGPWLDRVMIVATLIGIRGAIWILFALAIWIAAPARRMAAWRLLLSLALAALIGDAILKPLIARERPYVNHPEYRQLLPPPYASSFPSSHASTAAAGALSIARMFPALAAPAWALAVLIAVSRVALGVHFPTDIAAGLLIGYACARFVHAKPPRDDLFPARG